MIDKKKTLKRRTTFWSVRELFSVKWFAVVEGAMGDIRLINTRKGEDMGVHIELEGVGYYISALSGRIFKIPKAFISYGSRMKRPSRSAR